jgi:hypothetical protein
MEKNQLPALDGEDGSRDTSTRQIAANFPKVPPERTNQWKSDRPGKLHVLYVFPDRFPVCRLQALQPFAYWLATRI